MLVFPKFAASLPRLHLRLTLYSVLLLILCIYNYASCGEVMFDYLNHFLSWVNLSL